MADVRRLVVKVGTRAITQPSGRPDTRRIRRLVKELAEIQRAGREVVLVTSGAVGAGMEALGMQERPKLLPDLQMAAAVGQARLMTRYDELFSAAGIKVGQVLLTHADFLHKVRFSNARRTIENLLRHKVVPIINENDVVADEEIRADLVLGDNDLLASLVVKMIRADLLVLLTTVNGLLEAGPDGGHRRVPYLESITRRTFALVGASDTRLSKGGMASKLKAAQAVAQAGCAAVIANGLIPGTLQRLMRGEDVGTLVLPAAL